MDKFLRNYFLTVQSTTENFVSFPFVPEQTIIITPPFTMEFDILRKSLGSIGTASIRVYNLSEVTRNHILKDQFDYGNFKRVTLRAGYGDGPNWPVVFTGNISKAWSVREKNNFITQMEVYDGGFLFQNGKFSGNYKAGTPTQVIVEDIIRSARAYGVERGAVASFPGTIKSAAVYNGNQMEVLSQVIPGNFFVDNGRLNCINRKDYIPNPEITVINSASGLLGTPVREQTYLNFSIIFEPKLKVGQQVRLESVTEKNYNTNYKVFSVQHKGIISDAVCGDAVTNVGVQVQGIVTPAVSNGT